MYRVLQQSMIITPGVGLFEVNREWTEMTEQRILDSGVGSDLICLGEQPLHAVPLLVFGEKEFTMPHWINLRLVNFVLTRASCYNCMHVLYYVVFIRGTRKPRL